MENNTGRILALAAIATDMEEVRSLSLLIAGQKTILERQQELRDEYLTTADAGIAETRRAIEVMEQDFVEVTRRLDRTLAALYQTAPPLLPAEEPKKRGRKPKETTLQEVVEAARAAGAEVTVSLELEAERHECPCCGDVFFNAGAHATHVATCKPAGGVSATVSVEPDPVEQFVAEIQEAEAEAAAATAPYRPSNSDEGEWFQSQFCDHCQREDAGGDCGCEILTRTAAFSVDDPEYPKEWVTSNQDGPRCTAFVAIGAPEVDTQTLDLFSAEATHAADAAEAQKEGGKAVTEAVEATTGGAPTISDYTPLDEPIGDCDLCHGYGILSGELYGEPALVPCSCEAGTAVKGGVVASPCDACAVENPDCANCDQTEETPDYQKCGNSQCAATDRPAKKVCARVGNPPRECTDFLPLDQCSHHPTRRYYKDGALVCGLCEVILTPAPEPAPKSDLQAKCPHPKPFREQTPEGVRCKVCKAVIGD